MFLEELKNTNRAALISPPTNTPSDDLVINTLQYSKIYNLKIHVGSCPISLNERITLYTLKDAFFNGFHEQAFSLVWPSFVTPEHYGKARKKFQIPEHVFLTKRLYF